MDVPKNRVTGILLAGGKSQRMGKEKGDLQIGPSKLYLYALRVLEKVCDEVLISTCNESLFKEDHPCVCDELPGIGPMGGIYTCLKRSSNEINVVLSYDMPLINVSLISHLLKECFAHEITLPAMEKSWPEPLCGIYKKKTAGLFEKLISEKNYAVHQAIQQAHSKIIVINDRMSFWNPHMFLNINREEDLKKLPPDLEPITDES